MDDFGVDLPQREAKREDMLSEDLQASAEEQSSGAFMYKHINIRSKQQQNKHKTSQTKNKTQFTPQDNTCELN